MNQITVKLPDDLSEIIAQKVNENMRDAYYWNVTKAISDALVKKLEETGFIENIINKVYSEITVSENEFVNLMSSQVKESMLSCMSIMANEIFNKVSEKVKSYGFIQIGR